MRGCWSTETRDHGEGANDCARWEHGDRSRYRDRDSGDPALPCGQGPLLLGEYRDCHLRFTIRRDERKVSTSAATSAAARSTVSPLSSLRASAASCCERPSCKYSTICAPDAFNCQ